MVVHEPNAIEEVVPDFLESLSSAGADLATSIANVLDDQGRFSFVEEACLLLDPAGKLGVLLEEKASRLPDVLEHMHDVERVLGLEEEFPDQALQVLVAVGDDLDGLAGALLEAALVSVPASDGEGVPLGSVRGVDLLVDRAQERSLAVLVLALLERVHGDDRRRLAVFGLVPRLLSLLGTSAKEARSEEHTSELQSLAYLVCR